MVETLTKGNPLPRLIKVALSDDQMAKVPAELRATVNAQQLKAVEGNLK